MAPYCPGSGIVLQHKSSSGVPMICIGYKYSWSKFSTFLMTQGCSDTTPWRLYRMNCIREDGVRYHKDIGRPDVVTKYYDACGVIDHHNHSRQGTLALEEKWPTKDGWNRIFTTMCGIVLTDSWLSWKHFLGPQFGRQDRHPMWNIGVCKFGEIVASKILSNHSRTKWSVTKRDISPLHQQNLTDPNDSESLTSPHDSEVGSQERSTQQKKGKSE